MNGAFYVGAVGLQAQQRALDTISNNIANINTPSFKRADVRFAAMLATRPDADAPTADLDASFASAGVMATSVSAMDEEGVIETTGRQLDLAIQGRGFIELMGADGQSLLWRGGTMKVNADGLLAAADSGLAFKGAISVPADATDISIDSAGVVRAKTGDAAEPVELGQIELVRPDDITALTAIDGGLYRADSAQLQAMRPGEDGAGTLVQGAVERSNVELTTEMVQLMLVQRAYSANAQIVQAADQLMGIANGLRR
jgi:flagellar basal-body rod protein FlgG